MAAKSTITHQYDLQMTVIDILALPEERCVALSWSQDSGYQFIALQEGNFVPLSYTISYDLEELMCCLV